MLFAPDRPEKFAAPKIQLYLCPECNHTYHGTRAYALHLVKIHNFKAEDFTDGYGHKYVSED